MKRFNLLSLATLMATSMMSSVVENTGGGADMDIDGDDTPATAITLSGSLVATGATQPSYTAEQKATLHAEIKANFDNKIDVTETSFHFRKVTDPKTKIETKRNSVVIPLPVPSVEGIIDIIQNGGAGLTLLQEAVLSVLVETARDYIDANEDVTSANFPYASLAWDAIANLPKSDRRGGGVAKEVWADFAKDYIAVMPAIIGKSEEVVTNASKIFLSKFAQCKTNKPILNKLKDYLAVYINNTPRAEEFTEAVDWLDKKIATLLETGEQALLDSL